MSLKAEASAAGGGGDGQGHGPVGVHPTCPQQISALSPFALNSGGELGAPPRLAVCMAPHSLLCD